MKYNNETAMELRLQGEIQELLYDLNHHCNSHHTRQLITARLNGIATALHALTGEIWSVEIENGEYVFINEDETECITAE